MRKSTSTPVMNKYSIQDRLHMAARSLKKTAYLALMSVLCTSINALAKSGDVHTAREGTKAAMRIDTKNVFTSNLERFRSEQTMEHGTPSLSFVENKGQVTDQYGKPRTDIQYKIAAAGGLNIFIGSGAIHYQFSRTNNEMPATANEGLMQAGAMPGAAACDMYRMDVELEGANKHAQVIAGARNDYFENHFKKGTGANGAIAHSYQRITYKEVYPNIDWVLYISGGKLEHEFVVRAGGRVSDIKLKYGGATALSLNSDGSLTAVTPQGTIKEQAPFTYQRDGKNVRSRFVLNGNVLSYATDSYRGELVIDPALAWSTYYGGSSVDVSYYVTTDASGNIYLAGATQSSANIATSGAGEYQATFAGNTDAYLAKFSSNGTLLWATYYGGTEDDYGVCVATDGGGNVYLSGNTYSTSAIATNAGGEHQQAHAGNRDCFLVKFTNSGSRLWATYYGGANDDYGDRIAIDASGNVYMTGRTQSTTDIATNVGGEHQPAAGGNNDAYLVKFNSSGTRQWATYYGGSGNDFGMSLAIDVSGNVYLAGYTQSASGIATSGAGEHQSVRGSSTDAYLAKFSSSGSRIWATYYGGSGEDRATAVATDASGNVYIAGYTISTNDIATSGAGEHQAAQGGNYDGFIVKLSGSGTRVWGSYYGGSGAERFTSLVINAGGDIYAAGYTNSSSGIATSGAGEYQASNGGSNDDFLVQFSDDGTRIWATYHGGTSDELDAGVACDASGNVYLAGITGSTSGIATSGPGVHQGALGGVYDGYLAKISSAVATTWYSKATGDLNNLSTWGANADGSGANPTDFTTSGQTFNIVNNLSPTIGAAWAPAGTVNVGDGIAAVNFTIPSGFAYTGDAINVLGGATLTITNTTVPALGTLAGSSTVMYNATSAQNITGTTYSNLDIGGETGMVTYTATGNITAGSSLHLRNGTILDMGTNVLQGAFTPTVESLGSIRTQNTSAAPVPAGKTWGGKFYYDNTTTDQTIAGGSYREMTVGGASGSVSYNAGGDVEITYALNMAQTTATVNMGVYQMTGINPMVMGGGVIRTQNTSTAPLPHAVYLCNVIYDNMTTPQTVMGNVYAKLTLAGPHEYTYTPDRDNLNVFEKLTTALPATTFDLGTATLEPTSSPMIENNGTIKTQNTSSTPLPEDLNWGGTVVYNSTTDQTVAKGTYNNLTLDGGTFTAYTTSGNLTVNGALGVKGSSILQMGTNQLLGTVNPQIDPGAAIKTQNTSSAPLPANKTWGGMVSYNNTTTSQTIAAGNYFTLNVGGSSGTVTYNAGGNITADLSLLFETANATLNMGDYTLDGSLTMAAGNGTLRTQNTSAQPIPPYKFWQFNVIFDNTTDDQTVPGGYYRTLTVGGASGTRTYTASGILSINSKLTTALPTTTLNMGTNVLEEAGGFTIENNGTIRTQEASATPLPASKTWGGTVVYDNTVATQTVVVGTYNNLTVGGATGATGAIVDGNVTVNGTLMTALSTSTLNLAANRLLGTLSAITNNGTIQTERTGPNPLPTGKTWGGTVQYTGISGNQIITPGTYNNLIAGSSGETGFSTNGNFTVNGTLMTALSTTTLTMGSNQLLGSPTNIINNGMIQTQNTSSTPLPSGKTWGGTGTVMYNVISGTQTVAGGTYNNLTVGGPSGGAIYTANGNITVNGRLLTNNSASELNMATYQLNGTLSSIVNNGTIRTQNTSSNPLPDNKTWGGMVDYNATTAGQNIAAGNYNAMTFGGGSAYNYSVNGDISIVAGLTAQGSPTMTLGANRITSIGYANINNGVISTTNTSASPIPSGITWNGRVKFDNTASDQTVPGGTYFTLEVGGTSGGHSYNASGNVDVVMNLITTQTTTTLNMGTNNLGSSFNATGNNGTIRTQSTASNAISAVHTFGGTVVYDNTTTAQTVAYATYNNLTVGGASGTVTYTASSFLTVNGTLKTNLTTTTLDMDVHQLQGTLSGIVNNGKILVRYGASNPIPANRTWDGTVSYVGTASNQTVQNGTYNNLSVGAATGTCTYSPAGNVTVNGTLTTNLATTTLNMGTNQLLGTAGTVIANNGTIKTANTSSTPIPATLNWNGTVEFNGASAQSVPQNTYNNLTISNTAGAALLSRVATGGAFSIGGPITVSNCDVYINGTVSGMSATNSFLSNSASNMNISGSGPVGTLYFNQTSDGTSNAWSTINMMRNGSVTLGNKVVSNMFQLINGQLNLGANDAVFSNIVAPSASATTHVVATGAGQLKKVMAGNSSVLLPIGDGTNYTPLTLSVTGSSYPHGATVGANVVPTAHPNNNSATYYLKRYWNIASSGITSPGITITNATFVDDDVMGGNQSNIKSATYASGVWTKYNVASGNALTTSTPITDDTFALSGSAASTPVVTTANTTMCAEETRTLTASVTGGDAPYNYQWSAPSGNLGTSADQTVSPATTTVYTVVVTDAGMQVTQTTATVTVNPLPVINNTNPSAICSGIGSSPIALTSTAGGGSAYTWTVTADAQISGATGNCSASCGTIIPQNLANTSDADWYKVSYHIIPTNTLTGCVGHAADLTQSVIPRPTVTTVSPSPICSEAGSSPIALTASTMTPATFTWTTSAPGQISGHAAACGAACGTSIAQNLVSANHTVSLTVTYTVIASADGCSGSSKAISQTVKPIPQITTTQPASTCSNGGSTPITLTATTTIPATYTWVTTADAQISGHTPTCAAACGTVIAQTLVNSDNSAAHNVVYVITPTSNGCVGTNSVLTQVVKQHPDVITFSSASQDACIGTASTATITASLVNGSYTFNYTLGGTNSGTYTSATVAMNGGVGIFSIPASQIATAGLTSLTINYVTSNSTNCRSNTTSGNVSSFYVIPTPTVVPAVSTGFPGAPLTINGFDFNTVPDSNYVYFGATRAVVNNASVSQLNVTIPVDATYAPVTVVNNYCDVMGYSANKFIPSFDNSAYENASINFSAKVSYASGINPVGIAMGDIDGDGKTDLIVTSRGDAWVSVYRNMSTSGTINAASFPSKVDFTTGTNPVAVTVNDLDNDGKLDLAVTATGSRVVSVFRNTSTGAGNIAFATKVDYTTGFNPLGVATRDLNKDGKSEIVVSNQNSSSVSVFQNNSTPGNIAFSARVDFTTPDAPSSIAIMDMNGDGKPDLVTANTASTANNVSVLRNLNNGGVITTGSFAASATFAASSNPQGIAVGDLNGDNLPEIIATNSTANSISVFRNTSSGGTLNFATKSDFSTGTYSTPFSIGMGDLDGDSKADLVVANQTGNSVSVFRNTSSGASSVTLDTRINFTTNANPTSVAVGDIDGDGKADIAVSNSGDNNFSILRSSPAVKPISGTTTVCQGQTTQLSSVLAGGVWNSDPNSIATVTSGGLVTGITGGTSVISYTVNSATATVTVTVVPLPVAITGLNSVCINNNIQLSNAAGGGTWSSSNINVATTNSSLGYIYGVAPGDVTITYANSCGSATTTITVTPGPTAILGITPVCPGATLTLSNQMSGGTWTSSNLATATINLTTGVATGVAAGNSVIAYTTTCGISSATLTTRALPSAIAGTTTICPGATNSLSNNVTGGTWSSNNTNAATINAVTGAITGVATGTAEIVYTTECSSVTTTVTVRSLPSAIAGNTTICANGTTTLSNGLAGGTWTSGTASVANVGLTDGIVTPAGAGTTIVTYRTACANVTTTVTVIALPSAISGTTTVCQGANTTLSNTVAGGTWSSAASTIAIIDETTGAVTAVAPGNAVMTFATNCGTATTTVTVGALPSAIAGSTSVCANGTTTLSNDLAGGTWTSGTTTVANIGLTSGVVAPVNAGNTLITYRTSCGNITTTVTVKALPTTITGTMAICPAGSTTLSNAIAGGTWTSSNTNVAVINQNTGIATGTAPGIAIITYATECSNSTATLTVTTPPTAITGITDICPGGSTTLSNSVTGGVWTSAATTVAAINGSTGVVTPAAPGTTEITYATACGNMTTSVVVKPTPSAIAGISFLCPGGPTSTATLSNNIAGGTWTSSNTTIATVNETTGLVSAVASGDFTITYTTECGMITKTMTVGPTPSAITGSTAMCNSGTVTLSNTISGGSWFSSATGVANIGIFSGVVTPAASGTTVISYVLSCGMTSVSFTVNPAPSAIAGTTSICPSSTTMLSNNVGGGVWSSSNSIIATVNPSTGVVNSGSTSGNATINYTTACGSATTTVTVRTNPATITGVRGMCIGGGTTLSSITPGGTWSSDNASVANVDINTGLVSSTGGAGTANISYNTDCGSTAASVTVTSTPGTIEGPGTVNVPNTIQLSNAVGGGTWSSEITRLATVTASGVVTGVSSGTAIISYSTGTGCAITRNIEINVACVGLQSTLDNGGVSGGTWTSSNSTVATVGLTTGVASYRATGVVVMTYRTSSATTTTTLTVQPLSQTTVTGSTTVCQGQTIAMANATAGTGTWSSSNTSIATVSASGLVLGSGAGTASILYTTNKGCVATRTVNITPAATISGGTGVCQGQTVSLSSATTGGNWSSSNESVAGIVSPGTIKGIGAGTARINYILSNGCASSVSVTVASLGTSDGLTSVCAGQYVPWTNNTIGGGGIWSSSNTSIATVTAGGQVWGVGGGTTNILYTLGGGCVASRTITVKANGSISGTMTVCASNTTQLSASSIAAGGYWYSSSDALATVSAAGLVRGIAQGAPRISYIVPSTGCWSSVTVTVNPLNQTIGGTASMCASNSMALSNNTVGGGVWSSSNTSRATVNPTTGLVRGVGAGAVNIMFTTGLGCVASRTVTVNVCRESNTTSVAETATEDNIRLFPNPNKGQFTLSGTFATITDGEVSIEVVNMLGQVLYRSNVQVQNGSFNHPIQLQGNLANGMYLLSLRTDSETRLFHFMVGQ